MNSDDLQPLQETRVKAGLIHAGALPLAIFAATFLVMAWLMLLSAGLAETMISEDGPIEQLSFVLYFVAAAIAFGTAIRRVWRGGYAASILLAVLGLRELDIHKRFTGMSATKTEFFTTHEVALVPKLTAAVVMLLLGAIVLFLAVRYTKAFFRALTRRERWAVSALAGGITIALALGFDSLPRSMSKHLAETAPRIKMFLKVSEECLEMAVPALFCACMWLLMKDKPKLDGPA